MIAKHWNPKFKWLRRQKVIKVELPNYHEKQEDISEQEKKRRMKERGVKPPRPWIERPFTMSTVSYKSISNSWSINKELNIAC